MEEDGFTLVKRKKRQNASQQQNLREHKKKKIFNTSFLEIDNNDEMSQKLERCCEHLNKIGIFDETYSYLKQPTELENVVCFGLGNFASCSAALYQLAWIKLTLTRIENAADNDDNVDDKDDKDNERTVRKGLEPQFYDPIFTDFEKAFLTSILGYSLLDTNTECRHPVSSSTLVYMPRCYKTLYDNLLSSNRDNLDQIQLFSNSFAIMFQDYSPTEQPTFHYLEADECPYTIVEHRIPDREELFNIFTYQSIHSFERKNEQ